jgi:3-oxoacyl-(acyl-carrier-protein) synthase
VTARRVYLRGLGAITALGDDWASSLPALEAGRTAVRRVTAFDTTGFPCETAAWIERTLPGPDRRLGLARLAARAAWTQAAVAPAGERLGVYVGVESGRATWPAVLALARAAGGGAGFDHQAFGTRARPLAADVDAQVVSPATVASSLARELGALGPVQTFSLACSSSAAAIVEAARAIRLGTVDVALAGGVGADVDPFMLAGFGKLGALSARGVSCPFDRARDGFVVGEGAAMVVLSAARGPATVELAGFARSLDAHHLTAPDPEGAGAEQAMRAALAMAGRDRVDHVQAHGTSTRLNDAVEIKALRRVLGASLDQAPVSSVKGALGHWIAGAGALGVLAAAHAVATGTILPTAGLAEPDPSCDVPHVMGRAIERPVATALVNAFAFGGANSSLVLARCA